MINCDYNNKQSVSEIIIVNNTITDEKIISEKFNEYRPQTSQKDS